MSPASVYIAMAVFLALYFLGTVAFSRICLSNRPGRPLRSHFGFGRAELLAAGYMLLYALVGGAPILAVHALTPPSHEYVALLLILFLYVGLAPVCARLTFLAISAILGVEDTYREQSRRLKGRSGSLVAVTVAISATLEIAWFAAATIWDVVLTIVPPSGLFGDLRLSSAATLFLRVIVDFGYTCIVWLAAYARFHPDRVDIHVPRTPESGAGGDDSRTGI